MIRLAVAAAEYVSPSWIEPWHDEIMTRGRGRGIGIVNLTQRPGRCHNTVISETEHFFIFRLHLETDIARIKEILPRKYVKWYPRCLIITAYIRTIQGLSRCLHRLGYNKIYIP